MYIILLYIRCISLVGWLWMYGVILKMVEPRFFIPRSGRLQNKWPPKRNPANEACDMSKVEKSKKKRELNWIEYGIGLDRVDGVLWSYLRFGDLARPRLS